MSNYLVLSMMDVYCNMNSIKVKDKSFDIDIDIDKLIDSEGYTCVDDEQLENDDYMSTNSLKQYLHEVGQIFKFTREGIRQIEIKALRKLKLTKYKSRISSIKN